MNSPISTRLWSDALAKEAMRANRLQEFMVRAYEEERARPWHQRVWRRILLRSSTYGHRIKGAWLVLIGGADWERS